ncbi:hypothetical protein [Pseudogracilibacillus sp. ICA-222130]|uniref:hypothetical protein n=1 Tax=Pseudogracilibacillus sp. ICA-222130 TaxID=3134655 RepID=UPI0030C6485F
MAEKNKIILFPQMQDTLIEKSFLAMEQENFSEALTYIDQLLHHGIENSDIAIGKIICHIQLGQPLEAEIFCEDILERKTGNAFYTILFYYITILFEAQRYNKIIQYIDELESTTTVPPEEQIKYREIYEMCQMMNEKESKELLEKIEQHIEKKEYKNAFICLKQWNTLHKQPPTVFHSYLLMDIHEGIKAYIWQLLRERQVKESISVSKFGEIITKKPSETTMVKQSRTYKDIAKQLELVGQDNPVMEQFLLELTEHFLYMYVPMDLSNEVEHIMQALMFIGQELYVVENEPMYDGKVNKYLKKVMEAERLYVELFLH